MTLPSIIPAPYRLLAQMVAIGLLAGALVAFGFFQGSEHVQAKWDKDKSIQLKAVLAAEQAAAERESAYQSQLRKANHDAEERQAMLATNNDRLNGDIERLRNDRNAMRTRIAELSSTAAHGVADTCLAVLGECSDRYGALAKETGSIVSSCQTLIDAWPK